MQTRVLWAHVTRAVANQNKAPDDFFPAAENIQESGRIPLHEINVLMRLVVFHGLTAVLGLNLAGSAAATQNAERRDFWTHQDTRRWISAMLCFVM
jgi:hypothetical protein